MGLKYNEETAVKRDFKSQTQQEYTYLSNENIEQDKQSELVTYSLIATDGTTTTEIVSDNFVLTSIAVSCQASSGATTPSGYVHIYIDNEEIRKIFMTQQATTDDLSIFGEQINIPNWTIQKDTELKLTIDASANSLITAQISFIGYLS